MLQFFDFLMLKLNWTKTFKKKEINNLIHSIYMETFNMDKYYELSLKGILSYYDV
mgnify:CR=1 FL=1